MVSIPDEVFSVYEEFMDDFINDNFGVACTLIYPSRRTACANCIFDNIGNKSANRYKHGGPMPFNFGTCPLCSGKGFSEEEATDTITLRVYYNPREWIKINNVDSSNATAQVIGFLSDMPKFLRANEIIVNAPQENYKTWKFVKMGDSLPHGFKQRRYFVCFLQRID